MKKIFLFIFIFVISLGCSAESIEGYWTTIDDETGDKKSVVRVYKYKDKVYGRVVHLYQNSEAIANVEGNPPILGLDILWDLKKVGEKFVGGKILDPKKGKIYDCEMWAEDNVLIVRGKIAFLGRNQTWIPAWDFQSKQDEKFIPKNIK